jgi:hypothetical protein
MMLQGKFIIENLLVSCIRSIELRRKFSIPLFALNRTGGDALSSLILEYRLTALKQRMPRAGFRE